MVFNKIRSIIKKMSFTLFSLLIVPVSVMVCSEQKCSGQCESYITTDKNKAAFTISENNTSTSIYIDSKDFMGVKRVAGHLQSDIKKVTGTEPELLTDNLLNKKEIIIVGTIGKNSLINELISEGKLDVSDVKGKWEVFLIDVVKNPFPGIEKALVIAGSDKRGTIYGIYDVSEKIGVSPWYFWADVPIKVKSAVYAKDSRYVIEEPKVKYRGIFINDEAPALTGWVFEKYGGFNSKFYENVFELIMRLKGNFLWPAMWGRAFYDDDPENPRLADEYGVVISTSHHEPMMRAHDEWRRYGSGAWNYETNAEKLREFWAEGIMRMNDYESIITLAMRGDGDEAMSPDANVSLLQKIVNDQRRIIEDVSGKEITSLPQVWALYKEVQEYYNKGMRVPEDVTLLLCDDNWGNVRKLPNLKDSPRSGGYGMYYHFDYVGGPRSYRWLNTNPISRVWEQMHLTYEYGVDRIWIVNVGDIKPMEFPINFFLDYAWNPEKIKAEDLFNYTIHWSCEQFGEKYAEDIAELITTYLKYSGRRKPELIGPGSFSIKDYREAETIVNDYNKLLERAEKISNELPEEYFAAFYQLVLHPIQACANLNEMYVTLARNMLYYEQGRAGTNVLADKVVEFFNYDAQITDFYNNVLLNGKWSHMMDQTHIGYTSWNNPETNIMPQVKRIQPTMGSEMGVAVEGSFKWWPDSKKKASLPAYDRYNQQSYYIEVFNRGSIPFEYSVTSDSDWVVVDEPTGLIELETRVNINIDWAKIPSGKNEAIVTISNNNRKVDILITADNTRLPLPNDFNGFIEANDYVSIEAEHYTKAIDNSGIKWQVIPNLGRILSAVTSFPVTEVVEPDRQELPYLEYDVYLKEGGNVKIDMYLSPVLNFGYTNGLRLAVSIDDEAPHIINVNENETVPDWRYPAYWNMMVSNNIKIISSEHEIKNPGIHKIKFWRIDPGFVLQKIVLEAGEIPQSYLGPPESFNPVLRTE